MNVDGAHIDLTDARRHALAVLASGPADISNRTSRRDRVVDWRTIGGLMVAGLIAGGPLRTVWLTSRGQAAAGIAPEGNL